MSLHSPMSIRQSAIFYFFAFYIFVVSGISAPAQMLISDLKYNPCPPHATGVAMYLALFCQGHGLHHMFVTKKCIVHGII